MKKTYIIGALLAASFANAAQAETLDLAASLFGEEGFTYEGYREDGEDQIRPIEWVEYEGFRISFNVDPEDAETRRNDPSYFVPGDYYVGQWRVYANNTFTVTAPEGKKLTAIEFTLMPDYYYYGPLNADKGTMVCNDGETGPTIADKVSAKPYLWSSDNAEGDEAVTFTVDPQCYDPASPIAAQFRFNCATITYTEGNNVAAEMVNADSASAQLYDLTGLPVATPAKGTIYILKQGDKTSKLKF